MISKQKEVLLKAMPIINSIKKEAKKEMIYERVEEIYRGKDWVEKLKGILRIWGA
jgi:hypothetical protein